MYNYYYYYYYYLSYPCRKYTRLLACTWPPAPHAGNVPNIPCVPCIGTANNMPSIPYQHWYRKVYRKFCPILHQDISWKFSTILHKDWCRIYDPSCVSIGTGKCTGNCALYYNRTCHGNSQLS